MVRLHFNNIPEPFVNVFIDDFSLGTSSDIEGIYSLEDIPLGTSTVEVSAIGFHVSKTRIIIQRRGAHKS